MTTDAAEDPVPAQRIGDAVKRHRRELMARELERIAIRLFAERGYEDVSVDEIAEAAGVSTRTFYRYFPSKEDILGASTRRIHAFVQERLRDASMDRPLFDLLSATLLELAESLDLDEYRQWMTAVSGAPKPYVPLAENVYLLQRDIEQLLRSRGELTPADGMHVRLAITAAQAALSAASATWYSSGGEFVALVRDALGVFADGFSAMAR